MKETNFGMRTSIVASSGTSNYIVRIRVSYSGKRVELRPGIRIESKNQWKYNRVKNGCKVFKQNSYDINRRLIRCEDLVDYYFEQCEQNHLEPSLDELRLWFNT